mmetsp:Transcript_4362/g.6537  ORF Transcript_4362/g.6537 Transcript_4362/m.6537 type:complete len:311 (-) Transcript_4362:145-1077(-)
MSEKKLTVLVASSTANTGSKAVMALAAKGAVNVVAMARNLDKASKMFGGLKVKVVKGDFADEKSVAEAMKGVDRAVLVSGAGKHEQFDWEADFLDAAKAAKLEGVVRISTCSGLISPGTRTVYARAHASLESYITFNKLPVVDLNPNWFMDNILGSAGEMKAAGQVSWPSPGEGKAAFIDTRDIGNAAAAIVSSDSKTFAKFLEARNIEIHGPEFTSITGQLEVISKAAGYPIKLNEVPPAGLAKALMGFGLSKLFANSFVSTMLMADGVKKPMKPLVQKTSELLLSIYKPQYTISDWVKQPHVMAAIKK